MARKKYKKKARKPFREQKPPEDSTQEPEMPLPETPQPALRKDDNTFHLLALGILVIALFAITLGAPFQWDEEPLIENNPIIRDWGYFTDTSRASGLLGHESFIRRYVSYATFAMNYSLHGTSVAGYHIVNTALHAGSAMTLYWLVLLLMETPMLRGSPLAGRAKTVALATAALYAAHPVQTEAVTYVFQRHAVLAGLFYMLSLALFLRWRLSGKWLWYALSIAVAVLAMKSKANAFTLPLMAAATEFIFFRSSPSSPLGRRAALLTPILLTMLIIPLTLANFQAAKDATNYVPVTQAVGSYISPPEDGLPYLYTQFRVIATYLRLLALPVGQNLDYDYPEYSSLTATPVAASLGLLIALVSAGAYCLWRGLLHKNRGGRSEFLIAAWGVLWFFVALSVESSFVRLPMLISEYRLYLPSAGIITTAVIAVFLGLEHAPRIRGIRAEVLLLTVVLCLLSIATIHRNAQWTSQLSLWGDVVEKSPLKTRGMLHLGVSLEENGQPEEALRVLKRALELEPDNHQTHYDLGVVYKKLGQTDKAMRAYIRALELNPSSINAHNNLGALYANKRIYNLALKEFQAAASLDPDNPKPRNNLSVIYLNQRKYDKALPELLALLRTTPPNPYVHNKLGIVYDKLGQQDKALMHFRAALNIAPANKNTSINLAALLYKKGQYLDAQMHIANAMQLDPTNKSIIALSNKIREALKNTAN